ncbi:MAG: DUF167 domain-containing protein [Candidatus Nealsonbacteria bacterium]|nr:DUF167 domain-containing protein [Candidatus Nealsonbacteria bacterium]
MKIFIKAKPSSKVEKIEKISDNVFIVRVREPAEDGRANKAIVEALAEYFKVSKSSVDILSGHTSKTKIIEINN